MPPASPTDSQSAAERAASVSLARITATLEACAERDLDLTDSVYDTFFANCPDAVPLMGHSDIHMRGRMLTQVFELLLDPTMGASDSYLAWEIGNHVDAYGVVVAMYPPFFDAVAAAVRGALGEHWQSDDEAAWQERLAALNNDIEAFANAHAAS